MIMSTIIYSTDLLILEKDQIFLMISKHLHGGRNCYWVQCKPVVRHTTLLTIEAGVFVTVVNEASCDGHAAQRKRESWTREADGRADQNLTDTQAQSVSCCKLTNAGRPHMFRRPNFRGRTVLLFMVSLCRLFILPSANSCVFCTETQTPTQSNSKQGARLKCVFSISTRDVSKRTINSKCWKNLFGWNDPFLREEQVIVMALKQGEMKFQCCTLFFLNMPKYFLVFWSCSVFKSSLFKGPNYKYT